MGERLVRGLELVDSLPLWPTFARTPSRTSQKSILAYSISITTQSTTSAVVQLSYFHFSSQAGVQVPHASGLARSPLQSDTLQCNKTISVANFTERHLYRIRATIIPGLHRAMCLTPAYARDVCLFPVATNPRGFRPLISVSCAER